MLPPIVFANISLKPEPNTPQLWWFSELSAVGCRISAVEKCPFKLMVPWCLIAYCNIVLLINCFILNCNILPISYLTIHHASDDYIYDCLTLGTSMTPNRTSASSFLPFLPPPFLHSPLPKSPEPPPQFLSLYPEWSLVADP